ncbi:MAG TPA: 2-amino-4-hydroxy-6-hydroxymethyldihydropteridine diphosphokinase [Chthoniobacterales bacterium]|nr:2-amino-4-hydroxy-6-hydroxymethyldihydropteridine diphosphokinase [Chthoniobacterales bacterium]
MRIGIALGSNLGDREANLRAAVAAIREVAESPVLFSRVYETEPVDCPPDAAAFLNAAMEIGYSGDIHILLQYLQSIESQRGRPLLRDKNSPRTIDLDILYAGDLVLNDPELILPHPRIAERFFVLLPLNDIVPELRLPKQISTIRELSILAINEECKVTDIILF